MNATVRSLRLAAVEGDGWEVPVPLTGPPPAPMFPLDVFPGWVADMVAGVARSTQTDPAMAGSVALAVLSACAGGRLKVQVKSDWKEPVNVYVAVIADPGELKSPVHGAMTDPLNEAQRTLAARVGPLVAENAALKEIALRAAEHAKTIAAKAGGDRRDELTAEAVAASTHADAIVVPGLPKLFVDNATPEKLSSLMAANGGRMAIISDEGGIFDTLGGQYSSTPNLDPYLKGHSGRPMGSERVTREGETVEHPALTVCVMAQPSVLRKFGGNDDLDGRGLPARFLFALPTSFVGYRDIDAESVAEEVATAYARRMHDLAVTLAERDDTAIVALTPDAAAIRRDAALINEEQLRPGGTLNELRGWAKKLSGTTMRLAGLLHIAHHPADAWEQPIDADVMAAAVRLAEFFVEHYRTALHTITADPTDGTTAYVLGVLIDKHMNHFTRRELHRRVSRQLPKVAQVVTTLDTLTQLGWVRHADNTYELHPRAAELRQAVDTLTNALNSSITAGQSPDSTVNGGVDTPLTALTPN
ncbi:hypothetical protein Lfu02_21280 [Longispora fulva]|uniref:DUF3987 domain-containing protein n=1 Tax=Longispora fulva TaxID=619741 RepID=A0A8J7GW88_9ACTN|nr:YfjI family protein [Longispora fulva]MBG6139859.1 hypothetical protein [Longispora fulva]GIG57756.1 hypothetical protein Lfu02_21280 [Longispora fulva]